LLSILEGDKMMEQETTNNETDWYTQNQGEFKKWYVKINRGSLNSVRTIMSAMRHTRFKNDKQYIFDLPPLEFKQRVMNSTLSTWIFIKDGSYHKLDQLFEYDSDRVQKDDLKSGIKHYLGFCGEDCVPRIL
jgi:mRNA-degrading endonuclease HigB of HigAB toxin-antitoxin module